MAKKSLAALSIVTPLTARPEPPDDLTAEQKTTWRAVVSTKPADWFSQDVQPLLVQYCRHTTRAAQLARMIDSAESDDLKSLLADEKQQSEILKSLATAMRITPQSRYTPQAADTATRKTKQGAKPWEFGKSAT